MNHQAPEYKQRYIELKDSLNNERNEKIISELETEYNLKEKENQIKLQESELKLADSKVKTQYFLIAGVALIAILLLSVLFLAWSNLKRRKRINRQLQKQDIAKTRFFNNISHEMRNPLTLIVSPLKQLLEKTRNTNFNDDIDVFFP